MHGGWGTLNLLIIQATRISLYHRTSQMVHCFISWMRITRKWNLITLSYLWIPELECSLYQYVACSWTNPRSSSSYYHTIHPCSKVLPTFPRRIKGLRMCTPIWSFLTEIRVCDEVNLFLTIWAILVSMVFYVSLNVYV